MQFFIHRLRLFNGLWVHGGCGGVGGGMCRMVGAFVCGGCVIPVAGTGRTSVDYGVNVGLGLVDGFCYLDDCC